MADDGAGAWSRAGSDREVDGEPHHVRARPGDSSVGPEAALDGATMTAVHGLSAMASCSGAPATRETGKWCIRLMRGWRSFWWWRLGRRRSRGRARAAATVFNSANNGERGHGSTSARGKAKVSA
jgi:hypothetical protein